MGGPGSGPRKGVTRSGFPTTKNALLREKLTSLKILQKKWSKLNKKAGR